MLDHFIRGKKLACALVSYSHTKSRQDLFNKWRQFTNEERRIEQSNRLMNGVEEIADLKNQQKDLEVRNETLEKENEELRRFTMDGYQIAQSVKELADEKEKIMTDMKEKNAKIKELLSDK